MATIDVEKLSLKSIPAKITKARVVMEKIVKKVGGIPRRSEGRDGERYHEAKTNLKLLEKALVKKTREQHRKSVQKLRDKARELRVWIRENKGVYGRDAKIVLARRTKLDENKKQLAERGRKAKADKTKKAPAARRPRGAASTAKAAKEKAEAKKAKAAAPKRSSRAKTLTVDNNHTTDKPAARRRPPKISKQEKEALAEKASNAADKVKTRKCRVSKPAAHVKSNVAITVRSRPQRVRKSR